MALVDNDIEAMMQAFERADMINEKTDIDMLARETEQMLAGYYNMPLKEIPFGRLIMQTFDLMRKNYVQPPPQFALMLKSIMTIESFALNLDPQFDILEHLKPYAVKFTSLVDSPGEILKTPKAFRNARDSPLGCRRMPTPSSTNSSKAATCAAQYEHLGISLKFSTNPPTASAQP
jgi:predicted unusual protein kinase regulating ubiquinone biosynthesis (AarF/ABC1/UbiB family)